TTGETIINNTNKAGTYIVRVSGATSTDYSASCYTLNVQTGSAIFTATLDGISQVSQDINLVSGGLKLYPVPASNAIHVTFDAYAKGEAAMMIINEFGQTVLTQTVFVNSGTNSQVLNVSALAPGIYTLRVNNGKEILSRKMSIVK
ncbi:MAG TPA: T9SS type A sorting domain-containing protein, partial [Mucilaginibacter sp.]|nr:T9SS type A sorting domain-containing protein [Mucilaginibacter sp.]